MIDTDKYEGHTPGPWMLCCTDQTSSSPPRWITSEVKDVCGELTEATKPDAQLMADAPLLLEEVKRLRKTLACIAFSPDDPKWVGEKLDELAVDSDTWKRWEND